MHFTSTQGENPTESFSPPRGISPATLIDQVRNTAPFVFDALWESVAATPTHRYLEIIRSKHSMPSHESYFELCLAAHHTTVATFVPTDVDSQIRFKLWH